jgi:hypothetical protein
MVILTIELYWLRLKFRTETGKYGRKVVENLFVRLCNEILVRRLILT